MCHACRGHFGVKLEFTVVAMTAKAIYEPRFKAIIMALFCPC